MSIFHFLTKYGFGENPLGLTAGDYIEIAFTALLVALIVSWKSWGKPFAERLMTRPWQGMLFLTLLPIALRLALLPYHPAPIPEIHDDFAHLLAADTLLHFRLANPVHPMHRFFETIYVLHQPSYSSAYPLGQGVMLAFGRAIFRHPWAGVLLVDGLLCALCYWMLRGWTTPGWALAGGFLAVIQFTALSHWMNSYWGGALSGCAGCLAFGAMPRVRASGRPRDALILGAGLGIQAITRPFESVSLTLCVILYFLPVLWRRAGISRLAKVVPAFLAVSLPALGLILLHNHAVTGHWLRIPYMELQYQYGVPDSIVFSPMPNPHNKLTQQQQAIYEWHYQAHTPELGTVKGYLGLVASRVRFFRFYLPPAIYLALPFSLLAFRQPRFRWAILFLTIFFFISGLYPFLLAHYLAAVTSVFLLLAIIALESLNQLAFRGKTIGATAASLILVFCGAHFIFWYGLHIFEKERFSQVLRQYQGATYVFHPDQIVHWSFTNGLKKIPGKLLIFVRYHPGHNVHVEWVYNAADIDSSRVVWANDLGPADNQNLLKYYPDRTAYLYDGDTNAFLPYGSAVGQAQ